MIAAGIGLGDGSGDRAIIVVQMRNETIGLG
jgi:hypothetical protein